MDYNKLNIEEAAKGLQEKKFSASELVDSCFEQINKYDNEIGAFLEISKDLAIEQAKEADKKISKGDKGLLTGVPLSIKDIILVKDVKATGGSKILENYIATYDATVIKKLKDEGAIFLGKVNLDEFAMGSSTENSAYKKTKNPWDKERVPGGSSGGSTSSVAADMCLGSLGTDTGGSIRQPASFCGVVGLKPTYGRVSRYGVMPMTSSLDQVGPITKTVKDAAILFNAIAGIDPNDSTTYKKENINIDNITKDIKGLKIGIPKEYFIEGMDPEVQKSIDQAIKQFEELGAKVVKVSLPLTKHALAIYYIMASSEISSNLAKYDGIRYGYSATKDTAENLLDVYVNSRSKGLGSEAKRRIMMGTYSLSSGYYDQYYIKAQKVRVLIQEEFNNIFKKVDCLISPTTPSTAFKIGEKFEDPLMMYLSDIYTVPANIGGICGISIPAGMSNNLPIGLQIMGKSFDEEMILRAGYNFEKVTDWHTKRPSLD
ncbi:MAG: Asp-tRNA(Asn)/Glu-tRNA(Gln) amidotransferase subunit GatA [Candidatus Kerfeldbacteria bacterium]